jgi:bromodomain-containing protein 8
MDLRSLAKKLRDGKLADAHEYRRDLMLMLANAVMFNHEDSEVAKHAKELMLECDRSVFHLL